MADLGLFRRKEIWVPTWRGWVALLALPSAAVVIFLFAAYPFLAANQPNGEGYLIVEGWMSKPQLVDSLERFKAGRYRAILVAGGPISDGSYLRELYPHYGTLAEVGASQFKPLGIDSVYAVPRPWVPKDRTYHSGLAVREWVIETQSQGAKMDVVSLGPHARRSWILFRSALSGVAEVGVQSIAPTSYDPDRWWATSSGVRTLLSETIAYCYAKFLFYPDPETDLRAMVSEGSL